MSAKFLSQTIHTELNKEYSDILNTVDINNEISTPLNSMAVADKYRFVSEVISTIDVDKKADVRRKSMKALMQESFFHGAGWLGSNFIA